MKMECPNAMDSLYFKPKRPPCKSGILHNKPVPDFSNLPIPRKKPRRKAGAREAYLSTLRVKETPSLCRKMSSLTRSARMRLCVNS